MKVYEVFKNINKKPIFLDEHLDRLEKSIEYYTDIRIDRKALINDIKIAISNTDKYNFNIKIIFDIKSFNYNILIIEGKYPDEAMKREGVKLALFENSRINPNIKYINKKNTEEMTKMKDKLNVYQILYKSGEYINECEKANIFFIKDRNLYTARDEDVLLGVTRSKVIDIARKNNINVVKDKIRVDSLYEMDTAFITGTSIDLLFVNSIDNIIFKKGNSILNLLQKEFNNLIYI